MWIVLSTSCVITTDLCCVGIGLYKLTILYPKNIVSQVCCYTVSLDFIDNTFHC